MKEDLWVQKVTSDPLESQDLRGYLVSPDLQVKEVSLGQEVRQGPRALREREDRRAAKDLMGNPACLA